MVPGPRGATNEDRNVNDPDDDLRQAIAFFRYGLIADLVHLPVGAPGTGAIMRAKAEQIYTIPGTTRTRVAAETMRHWITDYRRGGFEALYPKPRTDRGKPRRLPPEVAERLIALKTENAALSLRAIIQKARTEGIDHPLASSSPARHFLEDARHLARVEPLVERPALVHRAEQPPAGDGASLELGAHHRDGVAGEVYDFAAPDAVGLAAAHQ